MKVTELDVDQFIARAAARRQSTSPTRSSTSRTSWSAVPENASEAQVARRSARAQQLQQRARAGEDFAKLAREYSDAPDAAANGGVVGLRTADRYPPLFVEAVQIAARRRRQRAGALGRRLPRDQGDREAQRRPARRDRRAEPCAPHPAAPNAAAERGRGACSGWPNSRSAIEARQADFAQLAREYSQDAQRAQRRRPGLGQPGHVRAGVRGSDEQPGARARSPIRWCRASACT